ncbi:uncharacterized protein LOC115890241 [Sitophilus oryzae]|uniref:Uncharacterized protein LOC115890241 n=1 Tax=Sitophilus oryzae TaxID=7048 RepID=A0A6J2YQG9_SITOR|nr:uncharacterized protein LOC115890241 [Sitophilus oryzae]
MFICPSCKKNFTRKDNLSRHLKSACNKSSFLNRWLTTSTPEEKKKYCEECKESISQNLWFGHLRSNTHKNNSKIIEQPGVQIIKSAFKERIITYRLSMEEMILNVKNYFIKLEKKILRIFEDQLRKHTCLKINMELFGYYYNPSTDNHDVKSFNTPFKVICNSAETKDLIEEFVTVIDNKADEFAEKDSGWILLNFIHLEININKFNPLRASSFIELPPEIVRRQAVVNIRNNDDYCFAWSIVAALHPPTGVDFVTSSYPHYSTVLNTAGIDFPITLKNIKKFENQNNISINVYGLEKYYNKISKNEEYEIIGPLHFTNAKKNIHVNLLLINDDDGNLHYCYISDLSKLISKQLSKHNGRKYLCEGCLQYFDTEQKLQYHNSYDCDHVKINLPSKELVKDKYGNVAYENILKYTNYQKQMEVPFVIYADFECILKPLNNNENVEDPNSSYTVKNFEHIPYSFAYYVKCSFDDTYSKFEKYRGLDSEKVFINSLEQDALNLYQTFLKTPKKMNTLTELEQTTHNNATKCHICDKPLLGDKVADYCHITGNYRGPAHSLCNINYKIPNFIPVIMHNLRNYDSHLFLKNMCSNKEQISVIPQNKEKYISFEKHIHVDNYFDKHTRNLKKKNLSLRFIDSFQFLSFSLSKLSDTLKDEQCIEIRKFFNDEEHFKLIRQKGVFPYNYIDSFEKLEEKFLPEKDEFFNSLTDEHISDEEYERALKVWKLFECECIGHYSDIYLLSDTMLLADIFENFRKTCLSTYKLDPAHFYTFPGLSWEACLRFTGIELELLIDPDMIHFFKNSVRGGVSSCITRKSEANNPFLSKFDATKPNKYIMYYDATNLYGFAMSQYLPTGDFVWLSEKEIKDLDIFSFSNTSSKGYVLEVDLEYPEHLHDYHNDFPFCPENYKPPNSKSTKLIPNLYNKSKYVIHYQFLKQCLQNGLKLTKIHRVIQFSQSAWLKKFIDLNTKLRNESKNEFDRHTFKLANNSIYGKTMENVDRRVDVRLVTEWEKNKRKDGAENLIAKPYFKDLTVFSENLVAIQMQKISITYNKPIYVGFSILDISKTVMYDFFYNFLKPLYKDNVALLYTDTDSFILEITTNNVYHDMHKNIHKFDTSNYLPNIHMRCL